MEKDLIILAIYFNIGGMSDMVARQRLYEFINSYESMYKDTNKDVKIYYLPVQNQETRVECIYPPAPINNGVIENELLKIYKLIVNSKNDEAKDIIRDIERKLKIKKIKNETTS